MTNKKEDVIAWGAGILGSGNSLYNAEPQVIEKCLEKVSGKVVGNTTSIFSKNYLKVFGDL